MICLYHLVTFFLIGILVPDLCFDFLYMTHNFNNLYLMLLYYNRLYVTRVRYIIRTILLLGLFSIIYSIYQEHNSYKDYIALLSIVVSSPYFIFYLGPSFDKLYNLSSFTSSNKERIGSNIRFTYNYNVVVPGDFEDFETVCKGHLVLLGVCLLQVLLLIL